MHAMLVTLGVVILAALGATEMVQNPFPHQVRSTANVDKYVDVLLSQVSNFLVKKGMDPMQLEDMEMSFSVKPIIITYHGELKLTRGWMQGISNMRRGGAAEMSYEAMYLNIKLPLLFDTILVDFDYSAKVMDLGPTGALDAKINNLNLFVDITIDTKTLEVILQDFRITDAGSISVKFSGHPLVDWLANALVGVTTTILHGLVQSKIQVEVRAILENAIDVINHMRPGHETLYVHPLYQLAQASYYNY